MPVTQLGNETTTVYADGADFVMERVFAAPRELVWQAITDPKHIPNWWGPRDVPMTVEAMDFRVGGRWRWIGHSSDGDAPFTGEYLEIVPPERIVHTESFDVEPFNHGEPAVVTITLESVEGGTKLRSSSRFPTAESLEGALSTGMTGGAIESWDRLAEVIASI
jgi:uncharacterized protein YndB with AHSA1/START domain